MALPSFILVGICVRFLSRYQEHRLVKGAFAGIRPVAVGLIAAGFVMIGQTALLTSEICSGAVGLFAAIKPLPAVMAAATFVLAKKFKVNAITLIITMGAAGALFCS